MIRMSIIYKQREMLEIDTWYSNAFDNNDDDDNDEKKTTREKNDRHLHELNHDAKINASTGP